MLRMGVCLCVSHNKAHFPISLVSRQRVLSHPLLIANFGCPSTVGDGLRMRNVQRSVYGALHCTRVNLSEFAQFLLLRRHRVAVRHGLPLQPHDRYCIHLRWFHVRARLHRVAN